MEMRCASMVSAYSSRSLSRMVGDVRNRLMMGWSPGLTLRKLGGVGMPGVHTYAKSVALRIFGRLDGYARLMDRLLSQLERRGEALRRGGVLGWPLVGPG